MTAEPLLTRVATALATLKLEAVMIGNAAAAIQGAPVTTLDVDFMFRRTARNMAKLRALADVLDARILRPYYPASELYRVSRDADGMQLDFMARVDGVSSFESLRSRARPVVFGDHAIRIASLEDIIRSKVAAGRAQDRAVLPVLRRALRASKQA